MWLAFIKALFELKKYFMRAGPQLGVDAYGVSGFTRLCRSASSPSQHSFYTLLRRNSLGRRFCFLPLNYYLKVYKCLAFAGEMFVIIVIEFFDRRNSKGEAWRQRILLLRRACGIEKRTYAGGAQSVLFDGIKNDPQMSAGRICWIKKKITS